MTADDGWKQQGACVGCDPELWFGERGDNNGEARKTCMVCPVRKPCLIHALVNNERFGLWGGRSVRDRRRMRRMLGLTRAHARLVVTEPQPWCRQNRASYNDGCRCEACYQADAAYYVDHDKAHRNEGVSVHSGGAAR